MKKIIVLTLLLGTLSLNGEATEPLVAIDSTSTGSKSSVGSYSFSHTISGLNRYLVVAVTAAGDDTATVTFGVASLTKISTDVLSPSAPRFSVWQLIGPTAGTDNITVSNGAGATTSTAVAVSFTGVDQSTPTTGIASFGRTGTFAVDRRVSPVIDTTTVPVSLVYVAGAWDPNSFNPISLYPSTLRGSRSEIQSSTAVSTSQVVLPIMSYGILPTAGGSPLKGTSMFINPLSSAIIKGN